MATYDELDDRVVLITGGANGIGQAMVEAFHAHGALVCFCDFNDKAGARLAKRLGNRAEFTKVNLTREADIKRWVAKTAKRHGEIHVLINNAARDPRIALEETEIAGARIPKGDRLCAVMGAANRDPDAFPNPDVFDPDRVGPPHLSLALGTHFCTGAGLARLEAQVAVERFLKRFPQACLIEDPPPIRSDIRPTLRGYATLEVELGVG